MGSGARASLSGYPDDAMKESLCRPDRPVRIAVQTAGRGDKSKSPAPLQVASPFSPELEGFQVLLLAGAAGSVGVGIAAALGEEGDQ